MDKSLSRSDFFLCVSSNLHRILIFKTTHARARVMNDQASELVSVFPLVCVWKFVLGNTECASAGYKTKARGLSVGHT